MPAAAQGWLTKTWRPLVMLGLLLVLLVATWRGQLAQLPESYWSLFAAGMIIVGGGRSIEKVAPEIVAAMRRPPPPQ